MNPSDSKKFNGTTCTRWKHVQFDTRTCVEEAKWRGIASATLWSFSPVFPYFFLPPNELVILSLSLSRVCWDPTCHAGDVRKDYWMNGDVTESRWKREKKRAREILSEKCAMHKPPRAPFDPRWWKGTWQRRDVAPKRRLRNGHTRVDVWGFVKGLQSRDKGSQKPSLNRLGHEKGYREIVAGDEGWCLLRGLSGICF